MPAAPPLLLVAQRDDVRFEAAASTLHAGGFTMLPPVFDGLDALQAIALHRPDVALLGCDLPGMGIPALLERLAGHLHSTRPVVHSHNPDPALALDAFRLGARGYLPCQTEPDELLTCIRAVLRGELYLSPTLLGDVVALTLRLRELEAYRGLSDRELEILDLIAQGLTSRQIAERLHPQVSLDTVETHRRHIREKLGITDKGGHALLQKALAYRKSRGGEGGVKTIDN